MSLWRESFADAIEEIIFNIPLVSLLWFVITLLTEQLRTGSEGQITVASFILTGTVVFLVILVFIFCIKTYTNLRCIVLKENPRYAKKRITLKEVLIKQIIYDRGDDDDWF
ncbi:hypothetical protein P378_05170 [Desulforamulus profundi]|uniref:Uncharacterized protein n=2 Tax=Desulforamulus TaxID=2916693 RepID=A0A2C6MHD3_9FIRM|nr:MULTISPECIES: hypothetical protein [Desulforamulus]PHJ39165.1 hypothetical protein P378_05170 [Desulforamulus profundi]SHF16730.1 hypothetical protein SAMN02745133_01985 [Desulforamulus putei DSM 12395]